MKTYQIIQERWEDGDNDPIQDDYPVLFSSIEEARERAKLGNLFEHEGLCHIAELEPYRDGVSFTGRTWPL